MSYILEALKKNQADQEADPLTLNPATAVARRGVSTVWIWLLSALLVFNLAFFGWYVLSDRERDEAKRVPPAAQQQAPTRSVTLKPEPVEPRIERSAAPEPDRTASSEPPARAPIAAPRRTEAPPPTTPRQPPNVPTVKADALSASERARFDSLRFTSHIYTDDPELCAVVINGQRLTVGDEVDGLTLYRVTETGAIFTETVNGAKRRVEYSPFE